MSLAVRPVAPFDLSRSLTFLRGFSPMQGEQTITATTLTKAVVCGDKAVAFRVRQKGDRERPTLDVDLFSRGPLGAGRWRDVLGRVRAFLSADEDLAPFHALAAADPAMAPLASRLRGLHHVRFPSAFEAACWGVINQRIQLQQARAMKDALVRQAGSGVEVDGLAHWAFPEPAAVTSLGEEELARLLPGGRRAKAVLAVARAFEGVDEGALRQAPLDEVREWLRGIHGVGPFTSGFVLYRGLGRFDGAAMVSPRLVSAAERLYGRSLSARDVAHLATGYGSWGGHWMLYVWASTFVDTPASHHSAHASNGEGRSMQPPPWPTGTDPSRSFSASSGRSPSP
jgi:DNA-3-methyladenine glycosylase II